MDKVKKILKAIWDFVKKAFALFWKIFNTLNKIGMLIAFSCIVFTIWKAGLPFLTQMYLLAYFIVFMIFVKNVATEGKKEEIKPIKK